MSVYEFQFVTIDGEPLPLTQFKGKVVMIVNTASECGFTPQYKDLEALYQKYKGAGFVVLGVPSNDFGGQEPGSNAEVKNFCEKNFGVTFPLASKEVVSGDKAHPFYQAAKKALGFGTAPKWNFHKYLVNRKGELVDYYGSMTSPTSDSITSRIEALLKE